MIMQKNCLLEDIYLTMFIPIVPRIPATFANMLFANWAAATREFAFLLALGNCAFIILFPEAHVAVFGSLFDIHTDRCAFCCASPLPTLEHNGWSLITHMLDSTSVLIDAKEAFVAIARHKASTPHVVRSTFIFPV